MNDKEQPIKKVSLAAYTARLKETRMSGTDDRIFRPNANAITQINSIQLPLLCAAPKIRNRIYGFVLGGMTLHACSYFSVYDAYEPDVFITSLTICRAEVSDEETARVMRYNEDVTLQPKSYKQRHARCSRVGSSYQSNPLDLSLLLTCSQIHYEAALVPFHGNTFAVDLNDDFHSRSGKALAPLQLQSIVSLSTYSFGMYLPSKVRESYFGVTNFTAIFEMQEWNGMDLIDEGNEDSIRKGLEIGSAKFDMAALTVCLIPEPGSRFTAAREIARLSEKVEQAMRGRT